MDSHNIPIPRLLLKATLLFVTLNLILSTFNLPPSLGRLTLYNWLLPGRQRLPYGDDPQRAYNLSLYNLEAMFASHELTQAPKAEDEYRVVVIGDSSVWGFLLENEDTLTAALNAAGLRAADGRQAVFYNLGHPTISLTKDLMILDFAMDYDPDLILWPVTLEAFPINKQTSSPLVQNNAPRVRRLIEEFDLALDPRHPDLVDADFWGRSLVGQRRNLADILRLQLYGFMWAATGIDVHIPEDVELRAVDLEPSEEYAGLLPPALPAEALAFDVLAAGVRRAAEVPVLIINEPTFVSEGANSDLRYSSFYPRWAYDAYRVLLQSESEEQAWDYVDLWQAADSQEFTNTPIHLTPQGTLQFANALIAILHDLFNLQP
ncbi:MAG TPA: hypothetical protein VI688_03085 [Anaerolineales bacterium]|nr:hypothetical protein [Anaerolineales bacterium]